MLQTARHKVVILGSSWGAMSCLRAIPKRSPVDITVVSPSTHFLFTPMLASSAVGTVNFRNIIEPARRVIEGRPFARFIRAECRDIDTERKTIDCVPAEQRHMGAHFPNEERADGGGHGFSLDFDSLVIATGMAPETFGTPGVAEHAAFLRTIDDARAVRRRIVDTLELASVPTATPEEVRSLTHFVIVGGGPTGVEFCGELWDLIHQDLRRLFPRHVVDEIRVTLIEPSSVLSAFDANLKDYTVRSLTDRGVTVIRGAVTRVEDGTLWVRPVAPPRTDTDSSLPQHSRAGEGRGPDALARLAAELSAGDCDSPVVAENAMAGLGTADAGVPLPFGACVWSTGLTASDLVRGLAARHPSDARSGRLLVDESLRILGQRDVFAVGDCSVFMENRLVQTAQVAAQEGTFVGRIIAKEVGSATRDPGLGRGGGFRFVDRGMLAYIGRFEALVNTNMVRFKGHFAWLFWRSAYLTMLLSWRSKFGTAWDWFMTFLFGRDVSRF